MLQFCGPELGPSPHPALSAFTVDLEELGINKLFHSMFMVLFEGGEYLVHFPFTWQESDMR